MEAVMGERKSRLRSWSEKVTSEQKGATFFENMIVRFSLTGALLFQIVAWVLTIVFIPSDQSGVILHYNVYFGVDLIGDGIQTYLVPAVGLVLGLVNMSLARWFYIHKERVVSYILLLGLIMIEFGLALASGSVVLVNY